MDRIWARSGLTPRTTNQSRRANPAHRAERVVGRRMYPTGCEVQNRRGNMVRCDTDAAHPARPGSFLAVPGAFLLADVGAGTSLDDEHGRMRALHNATSQRCVELEKCTGRLGDF